MADPVPDPTADPFVQRQLDTNPTLRRGYEMGRASVRTEASSVDLNAIRARADAATPSPWVRDHIDGNDDDPFRRENVVHYCADVAVCTGWGVGNAAVNAGHTHDEGVAIAARQAKADADFIAAARTDVPALLAEVSRQAAVIAHVRELARPGRLLIPAGELHAVLDKETT